MNNTVKTIGKIALYIGAQIAFTMAFIGSFVVETYLGVQIYGEVYMQRVLSMMDSPAELAFVAFAFSFLMVAITRYFIRPAVNDILAKIENS